LIKQTLTDCLSGGLSCSTDYDAVLCSKEFVHWEIRQSSWGSAWWKFVRNFFIHSSAPRLHVAWSAEECIQVCLSV